MVSNSNYSVLSDVVLKVLQGQYSTSNQQIPSAPSGLVVTHLTPDVSKPGDYINIHGNGFITGSSIYLGEKKLDSKYVDHISNRHIKIMIPDESDFLGPIVVRVSNITGDTIMVSPQFVLVLNSVMTNDASYVNDMTAQVRSYNNMYQLISREMVSYNLDIEKSEGFIKRVFNSAKNFVAGVFSKPNKVHAQLSLGGGF